MSAGIDYNMSNKPDNGEIYQFAKTETYWLNRIKDSPTITQPNKDLFLRFFQDCELGVTVGIKRRIFYAQRLVVIGSWTQKPFQDLQENDYRDFAIHIKSATISGSLRKGQPISAATRNIYRTTIKKLLRWMYDGDLPKPAKKWLADEHVSKRLTAESLPTAQEVQKLIDTARNPRDKCFISLLAELGGRISEVGRLRIKDVVFDRYGAKVSLLQSKTDAGHVRDLRIVAGVTYLRSWLSVHPKAQDPDCCLWVNLTGKAYGQRLSYPTFAKILIDLQKHAGLTKRINLKLFRHYRATQVSKMQGISQSVRNRLMGWSETSKMPSTYTHLSNSDVDDALLRSMGIKADAAEERERACPHCQSKNPAGLDKCVQCGLPTTLAAAVSYDQSSEDRIKALEAQVAAFNENSLALLKKWDTPKGRALLAEA